MISVNSKYKFRSTAIIIIAALLIFFGGFVLASSEESGDHGDGHAVGWQKTDTYRVMNFVALVVLLFLLLRKPVSKALNGRIEGIRNQLEDLELKKTEAENKLAEYETKLAELDKEAEKIIEGYIQQGKDSKERILEQAKLAAEKLEAQAKKNIEHEFNTAREQLKNEIFEKAIANAENIINQNISENDQEKLIAEYLDKVVA